MLKSKIPELVLFYDLEWVPDAEGAKRLFDLPHETSEIDAMERLWRHSPQYSETDNPRPFLKYMFSRIVSIAFLSRRTVIRDGEPSVEFKLNSYPRLPCSESFINEVEILDKFLNAIGKARPQLVGYNSAESDMQVLIQRAMINELAAPMFCDRPNKPWEGDDYFDAKNSEGHIDILKRFSGGSMTPRLDEFAKMCGYPGKIDVAGGQVTDLWLDHNFTKIIEYNQIDTLNTYLIWLRLVHFCGKLESEQYFEETEAFRAFLEDEVQKPEKAFIGDFLDRWPVQ